MPPLDPENLEVYCPNERCGNPDVYEAHYRNAVVRSHRKMTYMGKKEMGFFNTVFGVELNVGKEKRRFDGLGTYYNYSCPVCSFSKLYFMPIESDILNEII